MSGHNTLNNTTNNIEIHAASIAAEISIHIHHIRREFLIDMSSDAAVHPSMPVSEQVGHPGIHVKTPYGSGVAFKTYNDGEMSVVRLPFRIFACACHSRYNGILTSFGA